jgi:hypothetical protein
MAMMRAISKGDLQSCRSLLSKDNSLANAVNSDGQLALIKASMKGYLNE